MDKDLLEHYKTLDTPSESTAMQEKQQLAATKKQYNWLQNFLNPETH